MIFRPALITDLDAVERHYTELLTHEPKPAAAAPTGRWGYTPPAKPPPPHRPPVPCGCWNGKGRWWPASSSITIRMISTPISTGSTPPRRSRCWWCIPSASRRPWPGRGWAGNAFRASSSTPPPSAAPPSGWIPGRAIPPPPPCTKKTGLRCAAAPTSCFRAKSRRS